MNIISSILLAGILTINIPSKEVYIAPQTLEEKIEVLSEKYDIDPKIPLAIIECESHNNPDAIGTLAVVGKDIGLFQVNDYFHEKIAKDMGIDIYNPDQNLEYGMYLLSKEGTKPWKSSKICWSKKIKV